MIKTIVIAIIIFIFIVTTVEVVAIHSEVNTIHIDRKHHKFYVLNDNKVIYQSECGTGKGGLKTKKRMSDLVTPTGEFVVDLILYKNSSFNTVSKSNINKYRKSKDYFDLVSSTDGLSELFKNMNNIDFDKNGKADQAYGVGYIGLNSNNSVTGPKMRMYGSVPYWFSIAMHGTPNKDNIGKANSGGCVHLSEKDLSYLIENGVVKIGTKIFISDASPKVVKR